MSGLPTIELRLDDGTGALPHNITSRLRLTDGYTLSRGRGDEFDGVTAGQFNTTLKNNDGGVTPGSTVIASPSPIRLDQKVRLKLTVNGVTRNRFTGYLSSLPVAWPGGKRLSLAAIGATDAQARAESERRSLKSIIEEEILGGSPDAYFTLADAAGSSVAADTSGNQAPSLTMAGSGADVVFGTETGPSTDGLTAAGFSGGKYLTAGPASSVNNRTLECYFSTSTTPAAPMTILAANGVALCVLPDGKLYTASGDLSGPVVTDGAIHHLVWSSARAYLDGVDIGAPLHAPRLSTGSDRTLGLSVGGGGAFDVTTPTTPFVGTIAHVSISSLSGLVVAAHADAGLTGFAGESGVDRIVRLAGYVGLSVGTFDASMTNVPFVDITGKSAWEAIQEVADAEMGLVFFDGSGDLTFHNRNRAPLKTGPDVTISAEALAEDTSFVIDMQGVINYFEVTAEGTKVTQVVRDVVSEEGDGTATNPGHGRYPQSKSYLVQTDAEALDRANWIVANHAQPQTRAGTLKFNMLDRSAAQQDALLGIEPNSWIRVTDLPSQTPGGTTLDFMVQGFAESLSKDVWTLELNVVSRAMFSAWILGHATYGVLGSTTRLYV